MIIPYFVLVIFPKFTPTHRNNNYSMNRGMCEGVLSNLNKERLIGLTTDRSHDFTEAFLFQYLPASEESLLGCIEERVGSRQLYLQLLPRARRRSPSTFSLSCSLLYFAKHKAITTVASCSYRVRM